MKLIIKKSILGISLITAVVCCQVIAQDTTNETPTAIQNAQNLDIYC